MSRKKTQKIDEDNRGKNSSELKTESPSRPACPRHPESFPQYTRDECCLEAHLDAAVIPAEITGNPHSFISTFRFHAQSRANQNLQNIPHLSNSYALLDPKSSLRSLKLFFYYLFIYLDFIFLIFFFNNNHFSTRRTLSIPQLTLTATDKYCVYPQAQSRCHQPWLRL